MQNSKVVLHSLLLLSLFFVGACNTSAPSEEDVVAVRKVIEQRASAIREKNLAEYRALFMPDYFDGQFKLDDIVKEMQQAFTHYESIALTQQRSPVEIKMNTARIVQRIVYDGKGFKKPLHGQEILFIRRVDGEWKISNGVQYGMLQSDIAAPK